MLVELVIDDISIHIDDDECFFYSPKEKIDVITSFEDRFNTLVTLFSLKEDWDNNEDIIGKYKIIFKDNIEETYIFSEENLPSNFGMFYGFIARLLGDKL